MRNETYRLISVRKVSRQEQCTWLLLYCKSYLRNGPTGVAGYRLGRDRCADDEDIARNVADDPDAAPILSEAETASAIARAARKRLGISQAEFSARFHVSIRCETGSRTGSNRTRRPFSAPYRNAESAKPMSDTTYEIFQDGQAYKVRITRLGNFVQEADGFSSYLDAASWIAQDRRIAVIEEQKEPMTSAHLRVV
jgi:hypothetical protein